MPLTDYEKYIRTEELLALQKQPDELATHDELQFQVVHQAAELWMKLMEFELRRVAALLAEDRLAMAGGKLMRVGHLQALLLKGLDLMDTMSPRDYMTIRTALGSGSGQESPGFKMLVRLPGEVVWPAVDALLGRRGVTLRNIYENQDEHAELYQLCERLIDFDQALQLWRSRHLLMVYRIIGAGTPSLKGKPSEMLAQGLKQRFFPALWDVRDELFAEWSKSMLEKGKDVGYR